MEIPLGFDQGFEPWWVLMGQGSLSDLDISLADACNSTIPD